MTSASPTDIAYFLEIAETQNISRAAGRLGIRQPSLSMAVRRLENLLGTPLLLRKKSGVELTKAGHYLAKRGKALIQDWESLKAGVLSQAQSLTGRFSIGCHPAVARYALPPFLPELLRKNPGIEIHLEHDLSRKITESVISHALDFGIVVNPVSHPDLVILELCSDRITLWDRAGKIGETLLYDPSLHQSQFVLQKLEAKGIRFNRTITSSSLEVLCELARAGAGTAILPTRVARGTGGDLRECGKAAPSFRDRVCFVYRADTQRTAAARAIIDAAKRMDLS
jgi:molybdate transport repressor ModE-like protein